jgi:glycogen(starch) synthase
MLSWELPPHNSGGLGVACHHLGEALAQSGIEVTFILPYQHTQHEQQPFRVVSATNFEPEVMQIHGSVYDSAQFSELARDLQLDDNVGLDLAGQRLIYREFVRQFVKRESGFDVIHAHEWLTLEAGLVAKELTGKPLIAHVHATEFDRSGEFLGNPLVHQIEEYGLLRADRIIAVSLHTKKVIVERYGIPAEKVEVVHNSVAPSTIAPSGESLYAYLEVMKAQGYKIISNVGRLTVQKGLRYFLEAAAQAVAVDSKLLFLVVGDGDLRLELMEMAADLGIGRHVIFTGFLRGQAWQQAFAISDLFVMPSVSEPFGLVALEAAACQTPTLLSKTSGVAEILTHSLKFDFWDTRAMASAMVAAVRSRALNSELADNAARQLETFRWVDAAERCVGVYQRARGAMV